MSTYIGSYHSVELYMEVIQSTNKTIHVGLGLITEEVDLCVGGLYPTFISVAGHVRSFKAQEFAWECKQIYGLPVYNHQTLLRSINKDWDLSSK